MKSKTKLLIILAIAVVFVAGASYLFLVSTSAQQPKTKAEVPSTAATGTQKIVATSPTLPEKPLPPPPPEHQLPSPVLISSWTPPPPPEHQLPPMMVTKPGATKGPHEESEVPLYTGPPKATGDDCTDPIVVNLPGDLPYSDLSQTTCNRGNNYEETCLGGYDGGEDIIYQLDVSSAVDIDVTLSPDVTWTGIALDDVCPPDMDCIATSTSSSASPHGFTGIHLEPGTYYIMIDTYPTPDCIPDFDLTIVEAQPPPPNDDCANAEAIGDVVGHPFSTTLATFDGGGTCLTSPNIWYCYTATCTGNVTVSLCGSGYDTKMAVYEGCECDPLGAEIECNDDCCGTRSQITFAGVTGSQYLIEVGGYNSSTGDGILTISCHTPGAPPANDECTGAVAISVPDCPAVNTVYGTTKDATVDCPGVLDQTAVWYEFELTYAYNKVLIDYCPTNDPRVDTRGVVLYDECAPDCENYIPYTDYSWVTCPSGYSDLTVWWENLPAGTYYLPVYVVDCDENGMDFGFDICVEEMAGPEPGDNCMNPIAVSLNKGDGDTLYMDLSQTTCGRGDYYDATCLGSYDGGEDIIYEVTVSTAVRVNITLDPKTTTYTGICIDDVCPPGGTCMAYSTNYSASPHGIVNLDLDPGTYYIMIDTYPSPDCIPEFDLVITEVGVGPPNDDCEDAITIYPEVCPATQLVEGTTIGAGIDCPGELDWPAVWYVFEVTYDCNNVFIDFCEMDIDLSEVGAVIYDECPVVCDDPIYFTEGAFVDCPNGTYNGQLWYKNLPPGTYWLPIYVKDLSDNEYLDFAFGICVEECPPTQPGDNCDNPLVIPDLPAALPYSDIGQTTCGRGNYYDGVTCLGSYDGGEDIIYEVTVTTPVDVDITMDPKGTTWTGMAIDDECPPADPCMDYDTGSSGSRMLTGVHLEPGTYYIMIDTWPTPDCIEDFDLTITPAAGPPANDDCADATAIGDVLQLAFSTTNATFDGNGTCLYSPNIWYCYTAPCEGNATISLCGSGYDTKLAVYDGCVCDPLGTEIECNDDFCGVQSQITVYGVLPGEEYLIEVGGYSSNTGTGVLTCSCYVPPPPPDNDECTGAPIISTFPTTMYGTTVGATIDCPGVLDWDAVWYQFDVPYASNNIFVDFCPTGAYIATVGIVLYGECPPDCPSYIPATGSQWVTCPSGFDDPQIWWNNMPGPASYWFPVYVEPGKGAMDFGFEVSVEEAVPCVVECPPGGYDEGEGYCYDDYDDTYNGGCNSTPFVFQEIACGDTICGSCGVFDYFGSAYRDMDWFEIDVSEGDLTLTCVAEFPLALWLFDPVSFDCVDLVNLDFINTTETCDTLSVSAYVTSGTYWLIIAPMDWGAYPCGDQSEYVAWLDCTPFGPKIAVSPSSFYQELNPDSTAEQDLFITNAGGEDLDYDITHQPNSWLTIRPTTFGTILPGETDSLIVMFDAYGLAEGDYYDVLKIASNSAGKQLMDTTEAFVWLTVELPPDIDVVPQLSMGVIPGCSMDKPLRVDNLGEGELRFDISVGQNPPTLAGENNVRNALEALRQAGKGNPSLTPKEAYKVIGAKRSTVEYTSTGTSEGLLLLAGKGEKADILLVDDDGGTPGGTYYDIEDIYMAALDAGGYVYDYYNVDWSDPLSDGPDLSTMEAYTVVIWFCGETWGYYGLDVLTANDEANLGSYLDGGGNLFLSAQDWLWASYPSAGSFAPGTFPYDYLHLASASQDVINDPYTCTGLPGSVAEDMEFQTERFTDNPDVPMWTDYLTTQSSAAVDVFDADGGVSAIQYNPAAKGYKVVFTTTAFPGLVDSSPSTRAELMASIIDWMLGAGCPFTVSPMADTVAPGEFSEVVLTFDGTVFTQCVDETVTCYLTISSNDPDEPQVSVEVDMWSGRGDVYHDPPCVLDLGDVLFLINFVYKGGPAPDPVCMGDCNRDGIDGDVEDVIYLIDYLYRGTVPPPLATPQIHQPPTPIQLEHK